MYLKKVLDRKTFFSISLSGSISQRHGSADPDQNFMDPQHGMFLSKFKELLPIPAHIERRVKRRPKRKIRKPQDDIPVLKSLMLPLKAMSLLGRLEAHHINHTTRNLVEGKNLNKSISVFFFKNLGFFVLQTSAP
jgi:hypothetical protein